MSAIAITAGKSSIAATATNTAVGFTLLGLLTTLGFLFVNALAVFSTLSSFPQAEIKNVIIKDLEDGPVRVYLNVQFPGTKNGHLISAKTEGPLKLSAYVTKNGEAKKDSNEMPSLSIEIPQGIDFNLASKAPSNLVIDDLIVDLHKEFDSGIISRIIGAKLDGSFKAEMLPNIKIKLECRVVFKSLWIPFGASLNVPYEIDLKKQMEKMEKGAKDEKVAKLDKKVDEVQAVLTPKQQAIKDFNFKPRSVQILASDNEKLEIAAIAALPAALIPDFLTIQVPEIKIQANLFKLGKPSEPLVSLVHLNVKPFLVHPVENGDFSQEILVQLTISIDKNDVDGVYKLTEMARDGLQDKIGIQIIQEANFMKSKMEGGLMFWFRDFILDIPVGNYIDMNAKVDVKAIAKKVLDATQNKIKNQIISANLLKTIKSGNGGSLIFQIRILRSLAPFLVGKLPEIKLVGSLSDETSLITLKISSNELTKTTDSIDVNIEVGLNNLKELVYTGLLVSKAGTEELHKVIPEIRRIQGLKFRFISENIISKLASAFNLDISLTKDGLKSVKFTGSDNLLYPRPLKTIPDAATTNATEAKVELEKEPARKKQMLEFWTKFAIENEKPKLFGEQNENLNIGASIDMTEVPFIGDYTHISWERFTLTIKYQKSSILIFKIHPGALSVGLTGKLIPIYASYATGITIPSTAGELNHLKKLLKSFLDDEKSLIDLDFELNYSHEDSLEDSSIVLNATIPCKKLLLKVSEPGKPKTSVIKPEEKLPIEEDSTSKERTDFIGKVKNSLISFVSIQAATIFFHLTYPNGQYCNLKEDYDVKLNLDVALPMIEANICAKEDEEGPLSCFASAGISRPLKLSAQIIDGKICHVESLNLPEEYSLAGTKTIKSLTDFKYNSNEIPVHVSVKDLPNLARFGEMAIANRKQFLTIGPVDEATSVNKFIGVVVSSMFSVEMPAKKLEKSPEKTEKKVSKVKTLNIPNAPESPATIEVGCSSKNNNELEILLGFNLAKSALEGIPIISAFENNFHWPVLQWGMFDYTFGVENNFEASVTLKHGQIDLHEDGMVLSALQDFALRIKLKTNEKYNFGSTAFRQILGNLRKHFFRETGKAKHFDKNLLKDIENDKFYYKFTMNGPRGLNDPSVFFANGDVSVKDIIDLGTVLINRKPIPSLPVDTVEQKPENESSVTKNAKEVKDLFANKKITMKTVSIYGQDQPAFSIPCLIPAFCKESLNEGSADEIKNKGGPIELIFELENILLPVTELIGSKLGPILKTFKMANYPSNLELKCTILSEVWLTLLLDGAGLISFGLSPFDFTRKALIDYGNDHVIHKQDDKRDHDIFNLPIKLDFPNTLIGVRSSLSIFRRESLLLPPVAPVYFSMRDDGSKEFKDLTIAPFYMALSSDDRVNTGRNNLLSAVIAAVVPEFVLPAMNPNDKILDIINEEYKYEDSTDGTPDTSKTVEVKKETGKTEEKEEEKALGPIDMTKLGKMVYCLAFGYFCDVQLDIDYNAKLPFGVDMLRFILPSTSILRLYVEKAAVMQYVADSRRQKTLEISSQRGLHVLGTANINLTGLDGVSKTKIEDIHEAFFGK